MMKRCSYLFAGLLAAAAMLLAGCQSGNTRNEQGGIYGDMAGLWKADGSKKFIEINEQGQLVSFSNTAGLKVLVSEGGISATGPEGAGTLTMILGSTPVEYDIANRTLIITINIDEYRIEIPGGRITGKITEVLEGKISDDGTTWLVDHLTETTIDGAPDATGIQKETFLFRKTEE
jgi:hypothetical protein